MEDQENAINRNDGQSNVLLLILLAVVLFIALSYAIIQFGEGDHPVSRVITPTASTSVTQYASALRTGVTRILLKDTPVQELDFTAPVKGAFGTLNEDVSSKMVFHPNGGGVTFAPVSAAIVAHQEQAPEDFTSKRNGNWFFVPLKINQVGTAQQELVAILDDVKRPICAAINDQITGTTLIPELNINKADLLSGKTVLNGKDIDAQPYLCIKTASDYIYYHVLAEQ